MGDRGHTLTASQLADCSPVRSGSSIRAYCPFHGSDHQRSLRLNPETGHFKCFACSAWGYTEEARERRDEAWRAARAGIDRAWSRQRSRAPGSPSRNPPGAQTARCAVIPQPVRTDLDALLTRYEAALPGSPGERYLKRRRIPMDLARSLRAGYASADEWTGRRCRWPDGGIVLPHTAPDGTLLNLYRRAVEIDGPAPKPDRHDHLPGNKGYFNAAALRSARVAICEGAFDALALLAAGGPPAVAIFGVDGWRWEWARGVRELVLAFDNDHAGAKWREIARGARLRGIDVEVLESESYGGKQDVAEAWQSHVLRLAPRSSETSPPETTRVEGNSARS